jgi:hypothetical protein
VFENRVMRKKFGPKIEEVMKTEENCIIRGFMNYILHQILSMK